MYSELITHNDTSVIEAIIHTNLLNFVEFRNGCETKFGMLMTELNFRSRWESTAKDKGLRVVCGMEINTAEIINHYIAIQLFRTFTN